MLKKKRAKVWTPSEMGKRSASLLSKRQRRERARLGAIARWAKAKAQDERTTP